MTSELNLSLVATDTTNSRDLAKQIEQLPCRIHEDLLLKGHGFQPCLHLCGRVGLQPLRELALG